MVNHKTQSVNLILLFVIAVALWLVQAPTAHAQVPWTVEYLPAFVVSSSTVGYGTLYIDNPDALIGNTRFHDNYVKTLPTNNNYYALQNSDKCYPLSGGSDGFTATSSVVLNASSHQTSNTSFGASACNETGTYYIVSRDASASSTILYVAPYYYDATSNTFSTEDIACTSCTRIIAHDPEAYDTLTSPIAEQMYQFDWYVAEEDFVEDDTYISFNYYHQLSQYRPEPIGATTTTLITNWGHGDASGFLYRATEDGTYIVEITIYKEELNVWSNLFDGVYNPVFSPSKTILATKKYAFYLGTSTTQNELDEARIEWETTQNNTEGTPIDQITVWFEQAMNELLYMPPLRYASHFIDLLRATTTATSTIAITHTFPDNSPAGLAGRTITLDATEGLANAIAVIRAEEVDTIEGDPFEKFMFYWNLMWYMALVLWIVQQVFSMYEIDLTFNSKAGNYQKSGSVRGASRHGKNGLRREQYKSYD